MNLILPKCNENTFKTILSSLPALTFRASTSKHATNLEILVFALFSYAESYEITGFVMFSHAKSKGNIGFTTKHNKYYTFIALGVVSLFGYTKTS